MPGDVEYADRHYQAQENQYEGQQVHGPLSLTLAPAGLPLLTDPITMTGKLFSAPGQQTMYCSVTICPDTGPSFLLSCN